MATFSSTIALEEAGRGGGARCGCRCRLAAPLSNDKIIIKITIDSLLFTKVAACL